MDWEQRCKELQCRVDALERENQELRRQLGYSDPVQPAVQEYPKIETVSAAGVGAGVHMRSTPEEKICLFRSLFRGREDVFARRWYSTKTEKSGYSPVCANEWREGVCIKPKGSCAKCENRESVPLSDTIIYEHLSGRDAHGRDVMGIYPILPDDTCCFLAIDFDDGNWQEHVSEVRKVSSGWNIPCAVERSRSGDGAHLWIFFSEPIACATARKLGTTLLTEAMGNSGKLKLDSYDRMFPNQDTLPKGGFGNLIALPLQGQARRKGNSSFVNENLVAYKDQWAYLYQMQKLSPAEVEDLVRTHSRGDGLGVLHRDAEETKPWEKQPKVTLTAMDFEQPIEIVRSNMLYIAVATLTPRVRNQMLRLAAFKTRTFTEARLCVCLFTISPG